MTNHRIEINHTRAITHMTQMVFSAYDSDGELERRYHTSPLFKLAIDTLVLETIPALLTAARDIADEGDKRLEVMYEESLRSSLGDLERSFARGGIADVMRPHGFILHRRPDGLPVCLACGHPEDHEIHTQRSTP